MRLQEWILLLIGLEWLVGIMMEARKEKKG